MRRARNHGERSGIELRHRMPSKVGEKYVELPAGHLLQRDDCSAPCIVHDTAGFLMESSGKFLGGLHPLRHEPRANKVPRLDFDRVATQKCFTIFTHVSKLLQQAGDDVRIEEAQNN
jgi:hypothetical protein